MIPTTVKILIRDTINPEIVQILRNHSDYTLVDASKEIEAEDFIVETSELSEEGEKETTELSEDWETSGLSEEVESETKEPSEEEEVTEEPSEEVNDETITTQRQSTKAPVGGETEVRNLMSSSSRRLVSLVVGVSVGSVLLLLLLLLLLLHLHTQAVRPQLIKTDELSSGSTSHSLTDHCSYCSADSVPSS